MTVMDYLLWFLVGGVLFYLAFRRWQDAKLFKNIGPLDLRKMVEEESPLIVDVRESWEYREGHLPGAESFPLSEFRNQYQRLKKDRTIVVVCRSGNRSRTASRILATAGYKKVYNLAGGTLGWVNHGFELEG